MSKTKKILLGVVGVLVLAIAGLLIAASMQPDSYEVQRSRVIAAEPATIMPQLTDLQEWAKWNPWADLDPDQKTTFSDPPAGVGAWYAWEGNDDVGKGKMTITAITDAEVEYQLQFIEPFEDESKITMTLVPEGDGTRVTWGMAGNNNFLGKLMSVFMSFEDAIGSDFDRGLERLDKTVSG